MRPEIVSPNATRQCERLHARQGSVNADNIKNRPIVPMRRTMQNNKSFFVSRPQLLRVFTFPPASTKMLTRACAIRPRQCAAASAASVSSAVAAPARPAPTGVTFDYNGESVPVPASLAPLFQGVGNKWSSDAHRASRLDTHPPPRGLRTRAPASARGPLPWLAARRRLRAGLALWLPSRHPTAASRADPQASTSASNTWRSTWCVGGYCRCAFGPALGVAVAAERPLCSALTQCHCPTLQVYAPLTRCRALGTIPQPSAAAYCAEALSL